MTTPTGTLLHCSFCLRSETEVERLVAGPGVYICSTCVGLCNEVLAATPPGPASRIPAWEGMTDDAVLAHLPRVAAVSGQADEDLRRWVDVARERGASWSSIGAALGTARQSAWKRFSGEG